MSPLILLIIAAAVVALHFTHLVTASDIAVCNRHASQFHTNGCSVPLNLPFFYKSLFTPSCNVHDVCYRCGADHGVDRASCDQDFRTNMKSTCHQEYQQHSRSRSRRYFSPRMTQKRVVLKLESEIFDDIFEKHLPKELLAQMKSPSQVADYTDSIRSTVLNEWMARVTRLPSSRGFLHEWLQKLKLATCYFFANRYYDAVRVFGSGSYDIHPELKEVCRMDFTHSCLP